MERLKKGEKGSAALLYAGETKRYCTLFSVQSFRPTLHHVRGTDAV
jgi:hypothetical protein